MAADAIVELEQVLRSEPERIAHEEVNVLRGCQVKAVRGSAASALIGGGVMWTATRRLSMLYRVNLSAGAAAYFGLWRFARNITSCVDHILGLNGTQIQKELANIIIRKDQGEPWRWKLLSKHFYSEMVYEDTSDKPLIRWRSRIFFSDTTGQMTHDTDSHSSSQNNSQSSSKNASHHVSDGTKTDFESKQVPVNSSVDMMADPLDCIFGHTAMMEEIEHPSTSSMAGRVLTRNHKRSHRRRRMQHQEVSLGAQHA